MKNKKNKIVYVGIAADVLNDGHINILRKASKLGYLIVGVFTDRAIANYKSIPNKNFTDRFNLISSIKYVDKVVPQDDETYIKNLNKYKPNFLVHGSSWKQPNHRMLKQRIQHTMKKWNGKLVEFKYSSKADLDVKYKSQSSELASMPENRLSKLKRLIVSKKIVRLLECHNGLCGTIIEKLKINIKNETREFDGMWSSSLADSSIRGKPDNQAVDYSTRINGVNEIFEVTSKPLLFDADNGGRLEHIKFLTNTLERNGVSGIVIEDKKGEKINSLFGDSIQKNSKIETVSKFCKKIKLIKKYRKNKNFLIFARLESLILNQGINDAISRAEKYTKAGADVILIHSRKNNPMEIFKFSKIIRKKYPEIILCAIPSTYSKTNENLLIKNNFKIVIYANQLLRSLYPAMNNTAKSILKNQRAYEVEKKISPIKNILNLFN